MAKTIESVIEEALQALKEAGQISRTNGIVERTGTSVDLRHVVSKIDAAYESLEYHVQALKDKLQDDQTGSSFWVGGGIPKDKWHEFREELRTFAFGLVEKYEDKNLDILTYVAIGITAPRNVTKGGHNA